MKRLADGAVLDPDVEQEGLMMPSNLKSGRLEFAATLVAPQEATGARSWLPRLNSVTPQMRGGDPEWLRRRICLPLIALLLIVLSGLILWHPVVTNDGPVHMAFAHRMLNMQRADHPLQTLVYTVDRRPNPNLAVYLLLTALMRLLSPGFSESIVQILCLAGPVGAGYFALRMIEPRNAWLAIFIVPISLNQLFFFGLYNHCMSTAAFFLVIGSYFWVSKRPSLGRAAVLSGALVLTFLCHAGGFIMAFCGVGVMAAATALLQYLRERRLWAAVRRQVYVLGAMLAPLPLAAMFLMSGSKGQTIYDVPLYDRLKQFAELHVLAVNYPLKDRWAAGAISMLLFVSVVAGAWRLLRDRSGTPTKRRDQAIAAYVAAGVAVAIMLAFPDVMGGGWTHFRRFEVFPFYWALLLLAFESFSTLMVAAYTTVGAAAAVFLIGSMAARQAMVRAQMEPLAQVNRLIGNHCTVLPVTVEYKPVEWYKEQTWMDYQPYFQSASRLELTGDRVVLFNYLARLDPYPVHFRPQYEPQGHIFHWQPSQSGTATEKVDPQSFEQSSGLPVDYILLWGNPKKRSVAVQAQVAHALANYRAMYQSADGRVWLFQRLHDQGSMCQVAQALSATGAGKSAGGTSSTGSPAEGFAEQMDIR